MFYCRTPGQAFIDLFTGMNVIALAFIIVGIMFVIIEFNCTSKGVMGIVGGALIVAGIIVRMMMGGGFEILFTLAFIIVAVLFAAHILMFIVQKKNWLVHSLSLALEGSVRNETGYNYLKNRIGKATTDINPTGHVTIGEVNFFVSAPEFIEKGSRVCVVEADGVKIVVKQAGDTQLSGATFSNSRLSDK